MPIFKNCQPPPCDANVDIREWVQSNPPPIGGALGQQIDWLTNYLRTYACACGCTDEQLNNTLQELLQFFQNLSCPDRPLPVQDCLSAQILEQLQAINANTDELEITANNINLNANQINLNTDQVEALLSNILARLNEGCTNPLSTRVCNTAEIFAPIVGSVNSVNTTLAATINNTLTNILNRLNADCTNPLSTRVCNSAEISEPIVQAIQNVNLTIPPQPVLDCNLAPTAQELPAVTVRGVIQNRPCPAANYNTTGLTLLANAAGAIPANVKSWTVIVFEGSATVQGQPNILAGTTIKGGGYSDGSRTASPITLSTNAASRLVAYWEF